MFRKVKPNTGSCTKYTYTAAALMLAATIAGMIPYYLVNRIIKPLTDGDTVGKGGAQRFSTRSKSSSRIWAM